MLARLAVVDGDARPHLIDLTPDRPISIGRSRDNSIVLPREEHASRLHARVYYEDGHWLLRDFGMNGTRIDDARVNQVAELADGNEIRIGDVRLKFLVPDAPPPPKSPTAAHASTIAERPTVDGRPTAHPGTRFTADEMVSLTQFMQSAVEARDAQDLGRVVVQSLFYQTGAGLVGLFNLDPTDPLPKAVWPESAAVEDHLARQLTRRVQRDNRLVWLAEDSGGATIPTISGTYAALYADALALPLRAGTAVLGALHLYKASGYFSDRDRKFAEAVAAFTARLLAGLTARRVLEAEAARLKGTAGGDELLGDSPALVALRSDLLRAAGHARPILLRGEAGAGKAAAALEAHRRGPRASGPFVVVRSESVPAALLEAELFGYRKGAFSGADRDHRGYVAQADGGTLYIDEVTDLPADCQAKLAALIAERTYRPLGAAHEARADVKVIAATRRDLSDPGFRADLRTALGATEIVVPPLRAHAGDIPHLAQLFLDRIGTAWRRDWSLTPEAVRLLQGRPWPGNVRQLKAVLEHAAAEADGGIISEDDLRAVLGGEPAVAEPMLAGA